MGNSYLMGSIIMIRILISVLIIATILSIFPVLASVQVGADKGMVVNMTEEESGAEASLISHFTEDVAIFAIGLNLGLLILPFINRRKNTNTNPNLIAERYISISIAALIMAAGIIHILLVNEHIQESYMWGIGFIVMGISQLTYGGVFVVFANNLRKKFKRSVVRSFYGIGIVGNVSLVAIFIYVRLFVPPFSPEAIPVNEIEANGILTVVMEIFIVGLLVYLVKRERVDQKPMVMQTAG
jgi:hypothetical protein